MTDVAHDDGPKVDPVLMERLMRYDAEHKAARLAVLLQQSQWELAGIRHREQMRDLSAQAEAANQSFLSLARTIEAEYDIDLKQYAVMPETGKLTKVGAP